MATETSQNPGGAHRQPPPWQKDQPPPPLVWQGPELALDQLQAELYQIKGALEPPRPDIISMAADQGLKVVGLLQQWLSSLPPGAIPATKHKPGEHSPNPTRKD